MGAHVEAKLNWGPIRMRMHLVSIWDSSNRHPHTKKKSTRGVFVCFHPTILDSQMDSKHPKHGLLYQCRLSVH
jgi:hypothetical protein